MLFIFSPVVAMNSPVMILVQQQTSSDLQAEFVDDKDAEGDENDETEMTQLGQMYLARQMTLIKQIIQDRVTRRQKSMMGMQQSVTQIQDMLEPVKVVITELDRQNNQDIHNNQETKQKCCCSLF
jgi:hypothetical protein